MRYNLLLVGTAVIGLFFASQGADAAGKLSPAETASQVDQVLGKELLSKASARPRAPRVDDEEFIRRVALDVIGRLPTPQQVQAFKRDSSPGKRTELVGRLLDDANFGRNWARYWRDVILYRASEPRALITAQALEKYLAEKFNAGSSWKEITKDFITATGDVREKGETALIMAQGGMAEDTTAEISRIFMGIQIQCAQCHDHPSDRWKREQFHELAAFMPRIRVRPVRDGQQRSFEVVSFDRQRKFAKNRGGTIEHYMPNLEDPTARGTLMTPKFFVTNRTLERGKTDEERRTLLANYLTSSRNPWFTRAFVNRIWAELVGEGFYEPVDDLGPDRFCSAPETLKLLAQQFTVNQYDIKWLFATITATEAYQRDSRQRRGFEETPFTANCPQRLRGDQLFTALTQALGLPEQMGGGRKKRPGGGIYGRGGQRQVFNLTFGYDPSDPREEIAGSIPQALFMMNSPIINAGVSANRPGSVLGQLMNREDDDKTVVRGLYLKVLAREPKDSELKTCLEHLREVGDRREALEDVLWALVNSTEFLHRK